MKRRKFLQALQVGVASATLFGGKSYGMDLTSLVDSASVNKELAYHRIQEIKFSTVKLNYPRLVGKNARLDLHGYGPTVEICCLITDKGAMGWASLRGSKRDAEKIVSELVGKKVSEVFATHIGTLEDKYIAFDMALHDLARVILQKPVYALLGKEKPFITDYYSGMIYFDDLEPADKPAGIDRIIIGCLYS